MVDAKRSRRGSNLRYNIDVILDFVRVGTDNTNELPVSKGKLAAQGPAAARVSANPSDHRPKLWQYRLYSEMRKVSGRLRLREFITIKSNSNSILSGYKSFSYITTHVSN